MKPWDRHRRQVATYWPPNGRDFGPSVIFTPGEGLGGVRWQRILTLARSQEALKQAETPVAHVPSFLEVGGALALGDHQSADPLDVEGVHEVAQSMESRSLIGSGVLYRAKLRPLTATLQDEVVVYEVIREQSGRGYKLVRGDQLYSGPATVNQGASINRGDWNGAAIVEWDTLVTVPSTPALRGATRLEVEWGSLVLDGEGPIWQADWSPLYLGLACTTRKEAT